jgi:O-acetylhomoserine/O-acetylserine sulfhydrylase-like pyridoxal-dependent enzyme
MRRYLEGDPSLHLYTRYENPTLSALQEALAALEGGEAALVFASGMAASTTALLSLVKPGDEILASASLYGGTTKLIRDVLSGLGIAYRLIPPRELTRWRSSRATRAASSCSRRPPTPRSRSSTSRPSRARRTRAACRS